MLIQFKNNNPYEKPLILILKLFILMGIDFGFFKYKSALKKITSILIRFIQCVTLLSYYYFAKCYSVNPGTCWVYAAVYVFQVFAYTRVNTLSNKTTNNFRRELATIDLKLRNKSAMASMDKKLILVIFFFVITKTGRTLFSCKNPKSLCSASMLGVSLYLFTSVTSQIIIAVNVYVFYSMYRRLVILTANCEKDVDNRSVVSFARIYRSIAKTTEKYKSSYDFVYLVTICGMIPNIMIAIYNILSDTTGANNDSNLSEFLITNALRLIQAMSALCLVSAPPVCAGMISTQVEILKLLLHNKCLTEKDPRVKDWLFMTSPWPLASIIATYLTLVKVILPAYMQGRDPLELRTVIKWYNVVQIVANAVVTWGIMTSGWTTTYHFGCMLPDYSMSPEPLRMLRFLWWTVVLKLLELFETMFFVLRKKERQASFLHVWHHVSTLVMIWAGVKYVGGGITSFSPMINNAVHVIMYSYYLLSAEGSARVKAFLAKYKLWLTVLQMVQFTIMLIYSLQVFLPSCPAPHGVATMYFPNVIFVYYMFYDFFKKNYTTGSKESNGKKK